MRRDLAVGALAITVVVAAWLFGVASGDGGTSRYRTAAVARQELVVQVSAPGTLDVLDPVPVPAPYAARIARVLVAEDDVVTAGQLLATLDHDVRPELARTAAELRRAGAARAEAAAARETAESALARAQQMQEAGLAGAATIETLTHELARARAAEAAAVALVDGARATTAAARDDARRAELRASVSGVVLRVDTAAGAGVRADGPPPFVIAPRLDVLRLTAEIDEADVAQVTAASEVTFTVPAWPGRTFHARLVRVRRAPTRGGAGATYAALLDADDPDGALRPGMSAAVTIVVGRRADALVVPEAALRWSPDGVRTGRTRVHVLDRGQPRAVDVRAGLSDGNATEIEGGVSVGDVVIVGTGGKRGRGSLGLGAKP
jgi:HlyD family secretion protein